MESRLLTNLSTEQYSNINRCEYLFSNLTFIHFILNFYTNRLAIVQRSDLLSVQAMKVISLVIVETIDKCIIRALCV